MARSSTEPGHPACARREQSLQSTCRLRRPKRISRNSEENMVANSVHNGGRRKMSPRTTPPRTKMEESSFPLFDRLGAPRCRLERSFFMRFAASGCTEDLVWLRFSVLHRHSAHCSDTRLRSSLCSRGISLKGHGREAIRKGAQRGQCSGVATK